MHVFGYNNLSTQPAAGWVPSLKMKYGTADDIAIKSGQVPAGFNSGIFYFTKKQNVI